MDGDDGSRGVYRMRTFRLFFHIGRVECVTCHVSLSQGIDGLVKSDGALAGENVGGRSVTGMVVSQVKVLSELLCLPTIYMNVNMAEDRAWKAAPRVPNRYPSGRNEQRISPLSQQTSVMPDCHCALHTVVLI